MLPVRTSFSSSRATICSDVRPSGMVSWCCTTLPSTMVSTTSFTLACLGKRYSPALSSERALSANTPPMKTRRCASTTPSRLSRSAMSIMPERGGMLTTLSSCKGPGASNRLLPMTAAPPPTMRTSTSTVKTALPTITSGLRARRDGRIGCRHVIGLERRARAARRDAFGLPERRSQVHPAARIWAAPARPHRVPPVRATIDAAAGLASRRAVTPADMGARGSRKARRQSGRLRPVVPAAGVADLRRNEARLFAAASGGGCNGKAGRDPMGRRRRVGPIRARGLPRWLARTRCGKATGAAEAHRHARERRRPVPDGRGGLGGSAEASSDARDRGRCSQAVRSPNSPPMSPPSRPPSPLPPRPILVSTTRPVKRLGTLSLAGLRSNSQAESDEPNPLTLKANMAKGRNPDKCQIKAVLGGKSGAPAQ